MMKGQLDFDKLIKVLRSTGMQWKAIANCLGVSPRTLYRKRIEYGIADTYNDIT